ncbi:MAG TPA: threonine synthase [Candidatus Fimicola cottocaccae]|nr:threonine synthase [Candidatus Fimicola cottocaccae]
MKYIGTRNPNITSEASKAVLKGICEDGGLFMPDKIPTMDKSLEELVNLSYQELAYEVMKLYMNDYTEDELKYCINNAYDSKFDTDVIAPLVKQNDVSILELFHGRTLAFKDMALSILPYLMKTAAKKNGIDKEIVILTATSGDTGKAALEGFADVEGTRIMVFFPEDGVSPVQKLQMVTQEGKNTCVVGIKGNFDDAQSAVKSIFTDPELIKELDDKGFMFSSANSINIGRLVPQVVYYFYAYMQMVRSGEIKLGEKINFTVPTGNFGNILAGYYAKCMGLPVNKFICASNDNKVLYDFFKTGTYDKNREFMVTVSPSMDILISSNLERLLCKLTSPEKTKELMASLAKEGKYSVDIKNDEIVGEFATKDETFKAIKDMYEKTGYVLDTHTAVAYAAYEKYKAETKDETKTVIVSTASPYKFTKDVLCAIDSKYESGDALELMTELENISKVSIPEPIKGIESRPVLHNNVCEKDGIKNFVREKLN